MSIPIIMLLQYVLEEYASKNPRKMKKVLNEVIPPEPSDSPAASPQTSSTAPQSDFGKLIVRGAVGENTAVSSTDMALLVYTGDFCPLSYECTCPSVLSIHLSFIMSVCAVAGPIIHSILTVTSSSHSSPLFISLSLQIKSTGLLTCAEEASIVLNRVHAFLQTADVENTSLPWVRSSSSDHILCHRKATIDAFEEHLGIFPDGTFVPLTFKQRLFFGTPMAKLEYKIQKARKETKKVVNTIRFLRSTEQDGRDIALLREFILECLSPFKRYALKVNNLAYDEASIRLVSWPVYIAAWVFLSGSLLFFIYWIFAWGIYEGDDILGSWGAIFGTGAASDILLVQITKVIMLHYLPAVAMQPQLLRIRSVLADISMSYINRYDPSARTGGTLEVEDIKVIQHMSTACRASRSVELNSLPAAQLLRQVTTTTNLPYSCCPIAINVLLMSLITH
jgi:hypothetical protein